ncbi:MAG TPA: phage tail tape measure protein, partial [Limnochordia bacterium]|nr:phage tail tape measure protein [Limnochordia bacterium]
MAGEGVVGKLVYEIGETGLARLERQLQDLAAKPLKVTFDVAGLDAAATASGRATRGLSDTEKAIRSLENGIRGTINAYAAAGGEVDAYTHTLMAARAAALEMSRQVGADSREFVRLTAAAAQAERAVVAALNPKQSVGIGLLGEQVRRLQNEIAGLRNTYTAAGGDQAAYIRSLSVARDRALDLADGLQEDSDAYRQLTMAAAQAERGISAATKATLGETNPLREKIAALQNEINGVRNQYIAVGRPAEAFANDMRLLRDRAIGLAQGLAKNSYEFRQLATAAAQAERAAISALGGISRLGLASQVQRGTLGLGPMLMGVGGAASSVVGVAPGNVGMTAYFAHNAVRDLAKLGPGLATATVAGVAFAGALAYGASEAAKLAQKQAFLEAITGQNKGAYDSLTVTLQRLSMELPVTATDLYDTAEAAAEVGVNGAQNIAAFTAAVQRLAIVTRGNSAQIAEDLAKFLAETGLTSESPGYINELTKVANALAAVHITSAATADETLTLARYFSSVATQVGLTRPQILALAGSLAALGGQAQTSGTNLAKFFLDMARGAAGTTDQFKAMALIAGESVGDFKALVENNPVDAFMELAKGLQKAEGHGAQFAQAMDLIGADNERLVRVLGQASVGSKSFVDILDQVTKAEKDQGLLAGTVAQATNNLIDQWKIAGNEFRYLTSILGKTVDIPLLGLLKDVNALLAGQIDNVQRLIASYETWADVLTGKIDFADFKAKFSEHLKLIQGMAAAAVSQGQAEKVVGTGLDLPQIAGGTGGAGVAKSTGETLKEALARIDQQYNTALADAYARVRIEHLTQANPGPPMIDTQPATEQRFIDTVNALTQHGYDWMAAVDKALSGDKTLGVPAFKDEIANAAKSAKDWALNLAENQVTLDDITAGQKASVAKIVQTYLSSQTASADAVNATIQRVTGVRTGGYLSVDQMNAAVKSLQDSLDNDTAALEKLVGAGATLFPYQPAQVPATREPTITHATAAVNEQAAIDKLQAMLDEATRSAALHGQEIDIQKALDAIDATREPADTFVNDLVKLDSALADFQAQFSGPDAQNFADS